MSAADVETETASRRDWGRGQGNGDHVRRGAGGEGSTAEQVEATASATAEKVETSSAVSPLFILFVDSSSFSNLIFSVANF